VDLAAGYTFYKGNREQYVRAGILLEDFTYGTKNELDAESEQRQIALQWQVRLGLGNDWYLFSEGEAGNGFDRVFTNPALTPELVRHERRENSAQLRVSKLEDNGTGWAAWIDWYDFMEAKQFRPPRIDYEYRNTIYNIAVEHTRIIGDRHRWRFLVHYVDQQAERRGHYEHDYDRTDWLGGVFYEYLWPNSGATLAYAFAQPDASLQIADPNDVIELHNYVDKLIAGWRYDFSQDAHIRFSLSHEVSSRGFGGGSVQFQMFF
jgi:hypothetical protein